MKTFVIFCVIATGLCNKQDEQMLGDYSTDYIGNPDDFSIIERPCQIYDINCLRKFFASHAKCTIAQGPIPDTYPATQVTYYLTNQNFTLIANQGRRDGLRSVRVEEFYINKATNNVVFAINFQNLTESTETLFINFHRRGREPITGLTNAFATFSSITFTAIIPNIDDMQLDKAEITAFSDSALPPFFVGPQALSSLDPAAVTEFLSAVATLPFTTQNYLLATSQFYPLFYIQANICDFGLSVNF